MALNAIGLDLSYVAQEAIGQFRVVRLTGLGKVNLPAAAKGGPICGVTQDSAAASGDVVRVRRVGLSKVVFGTSCTAGASVAAHDTNGRCGVPVAAWASGDDILGMADEAVAASGDIGSVWVMAREVL